MEYTTAWDYYNYWSIALLASVTSLSISATPSGVLRQFCTNLYSSGSDVTSRSVFGIEWYCLGGGIVDILMHFTNFRLAPQQIAGLCHHSQVQIFPIMSHYNLIGYWDDAVDLKANNFAQYPFCIRNNRSNLTVEYHDALSLPITVSTQVLQLAIPIIHKQFIDFHIRLYLLFAVKVYTPSI